MGAYQIPLESVFKRDRAVVISGLVGISVAGWAYMVFGMGATCPHTSMHGMHSWEAADFILTFIMWTIMMVAMMVPSVAPTVLMFATICRKRHEVQEAAVPAGLFLLGYLVAWTWYSALATLGQWALWIAAFSPSIDFDPSLFGGGLLLATGIFQFTPLKYACLARCRSPLGFFLKEWREGSWGAFMMGLRSGNFCVICCWALMSLMFIAGAMSLFWMDIITAFVLVEKVAPGEKWVSYISGLFLIVWGIWMSVFGY